MAKKWRNRTGTIELTGFDELWEACKKAGKDAEIEGRKCFEHCAEVIYDELEAKAVQAGLDGRLVEQINEDMIENTKAGVWYCSIGWKKQRPAKNGKLPDTYKVMFYNYGTPSDRYTKKGAYRGKESAHPPNSHGFIKKAKLAAKNKTVKIQKETLAKILKGLK
jgi:HK97 gp10 family phage protein